MHFNHFISLTLWTFLSVSFCIELFNERLCHINCVNLAEMNHCNYFFTLHFFRVFVIFVLPWRHHLLHLIYLFIFFFIICIIWMLIYYYYLPSKRDVIFIFLIEFFFQYKIIIYLRKNDYFHFKNWWLLIRLIFFLLSQQKKIHKILNSNFFLKISYAFWFFFFFASLLLWNCIFININKSFPIVYLILNANESIINVCAHKMHFHKKQYIYWFQNRSIFFLFSMLYIVFEYILFFICVQWLWTCLVLLLLTWLNRGAFQMDFGCFDDNSSMYILLFHKVLFRFSEMYTFFRILVCDIWTF